MPLNDLLHNDEWILFQIKEGPCNAGCDYCYERPVALKLLEKLTPESKAEAVQMDNAQLARFITEKNNSLGLEMSVEELRRYFTLLKEAGIGRAGLIGSEPTAHTKFSEILNVAQNEGIGLLVYTAGMAPDKLVHPAIKYVVLHLDYGRMGEDHVKRWLEEGRLPHEEYMKKINKLVDAGKKIDLRVNFSSHDMFEKNLAFNFYEKLHPTNRAKVLFKYSFSTRVYDEPTLPYFTPETLRQIAPKIKNFVDEFKKRFPEAPMFAERPLFPCSFSPEEWESYVEKGGFVSRCDMEYTIYDTGLALCPPSRDLIAGTQIKTAGQLTRRIRELRQEMKELYLVPSFDACTNCELRKNLDCQGGCLGYKMGLK